MGVRGIWPLLVAIVAGCASTPANTADGPAREVTDVQRGAYTSISAGGWHTCAVSESKQLLCWGWNRHGQLGTGDDADRRVPTRVKGLPGPVAAVAAGMAHTCAVGVDGGVWCWGWNAYGQVDGKESPDVFAPRKVAVGALAKGAAAGWTHSCALSRTGVVTCWGRSQVARTGHVMAGIYAPAPVGGVPGSAVQVVAGVSHSCARVPGEGLLCWGENQFWQLGVAERDWDALPEPDPRLGHEVSLAAAGFYHTCAVVAGETPGVHCWGGNRFGQLGRRAQARAISSQPVPGLGATVTGLAAGEGHTCAVVDEGLSVRCWGDNRDGQLGTGDRTASVRPREVVDLAGPIEALSAGRGHICALTTAGAVRCWGANRWGQLGDASTAAGLSPRPLAAPAETAVAPKPRPAGCGACKKTCPACPDQPPPCPEPKVRPCPPCPALCPPVECPPCPDGPACPPVIGCTCPERACPSPPEPDCPECTVPVRSDCPPPRLCEACAQPMQCPSPGSPCPPCPEGTEPVPHQPGPGLLPGPTLPR